MESNNQDIYIENLAKNVLETRFEDFDPETIENARYRIIDTVGCLIGGANAPGNRGLVGLVRDWGGKEEATILMHGGKAPVHNAAMVNSIMARSFDFEPVSPLVDGVSVPGHISGTTVPVAVSMGEMKGVTGRGGLDRTPGSPFRSFRLLSPLHQRVPQPRCPDQRPWREILR